MSFFFLLLYIIVSYVHPGEILPSLTPYRVTFWIGIIGLLISPVLIFKRRGRPLRSVQFSLMLAFFIALISSWAIADRWWGAIPAAIQEFAPSYTMFVLTVCCVDSIRKLKVVTGLLIVLSVIAMLQGAAAYHFDINSRLFIYDPATHAEDTIQAEGDEGDQPREPAEPAEGESLEAKRIRGLGLFHDPNDLALTFVIAISLIGVARPGSKFQKIVFIIIPAVALCYGVYLTHSRGGTVGALAVLLLIFAARYGRWRAFLIVAVVASIALAIDIGGGRGFTSADESMAGRIEAWAEGLQMLKSQPLTGIGYRQFTDHNELTAHNSFVLCFAETGLVGYFVWLSLLIMTFVQIRALKSSAGNEPPMAEFRHLASVFQLALFGFVVPAFFLSRTYVPLLYLLIGLSTALIVIAKEHKVPIVIPRWPRMIGLVAASEFATIALIYFMSKFPTSS